MKKVEPLRDAVKFVRTEPKWAEVLNNSAKQVAGAVRRGDPLGILENAVPLFLASLVLIVAVRSGR